MGQIRVYKKNCRLGRATVNTVLIGICEQGRSSKIKYYVEKIIGSRNHGLVNWRAFNWSKPNAL